MIPRIINIPKNMSFFLFGARGTGKSTLIKAMFPAETTHYINLLLATEEYRFARDPDLLLREVTGLGGNISTVMIDEVQKVPKLLDIVHELMQSSKRRFVLTGSSARKLKADGANLLAGRAVQRYLFPFSFVELADRFDLQSALAWGTLPEVIFLEDDEEKKDYLRTYAATYLKEEIWAEHLVRELEPFRLFLELAAQMDGKILNFSQISRDVGVSDKTIKTYYSILEETHLGFFLPPFNRSLRKTLGQAPKFYLFDTGVSRALARYLEMKPAPGSSVYGDVFERYVIAEFIRLASYVKPDYRFYFLDLDSKGEVDLVIDRPGEKLALVEIKSSKVIKHDHLRGLNKAKALIKEKVESYCLSQDPKPQLFKDEGVLALPWQQGIKKIIGI